MASTSTRKRKSSKPKKGAKMSSAPKKAILKASPTSSSKVDKETSVGKVKASQISKKDTSGKISKDDDKPTTEIAHDSPKYLKELKISSDRKIPKIVRQEAWRYVRIKGGWRKPKGIDSKMRVSMKGWPKSHTVGYGSSPIIRGIHPSGYRDVLISNTKELELLSPDKEAGRIRATVGARKRGVIINRARELGVKILNPTGRRQIGSKE